MTQVEAPTLTSYLLDVPAVVALVEVERHWSKCSTPQLRDHYFEFVTSAKTFLDTTECPEGRRHLEAEIALRAKIAGRWRKKPATFANRLRADFGTGLAKLGIHDELEWLTLDSLLAAYRDITHADKFCAERDRTSWRAVNASFLAAREALVCMRDMEDDFDPDCVWDTDTPLLWSPQDKRLPPSSVVRSRVAGALFSAHVDAWDADAASRCLADMTAREEFRAVDKSAKELAGLRIEDLTQLVIQRARIGAPEPLKHAQAVFRKNIARAERRGLNYSKFRQRAESAIAAPSSATFVLNHRLQADNALRFGAITAAVHEATINRINQKSAMRKTVGGVSPDTKQVRSPARLLRPERRQSYWDCMSTGEVPSFEPFDVSIFLDVVRDLLAKQPWSAVEAAEWLTKLASQIGDNVGWKNFRALTFSMAADLYLLGQAYEQFLKFTSDVSDWRGGRRANLSIKRLAVQHALGMPPNGDDVVNAFVGDVDVISDAYPELFRNHFQRHFFARYPDSSWFDGVAEAAPGRPPGDIMSMCYCALLPEDVQHRYRASSRPWLRLDLHKIRSADDELKNLARSAANALRDELGVPRIGEGWVTETLLFTQICGNFPHLKVIPHARPEWLGLQHYDVWIPELHLAVEYHGEQHRSPVPLFGGEEGFKNTVERDQRKASRSIKEGVLLIVVHDPKRFPDVIEAIQGEAATCEKARRTAGRLIELT